MARELSTKERELLANMFEGLPTVRNLGLDTENAFIFKSDHWPHPEGSEPSKWPRKLLPGEEGVVWASRGNPFDEKGYVDVRLFGVDGAIKRPNYSYRYLPNDGDIEDKYPKTFRRYSYGLEEIHFGKKDIRPIPFNVTRQVVEVFDCLPKSARIGARTHHMVNRQIYLQNESNDQFAPFKIVSTSRFEPAPVGYVNPVGGSKRELWLEATRKFVFNGAEVTYYRSGDGVMQITEPVDPLSVRMGFVESIGEAEVAYLSPSK